MTLLRRVIGRALRRARRDQGKTLRDVAETARVGVERVGASVHVLPGRDRVASTRGSGVRLAA